MALGTVNGRPLQEMKMILILWANIIDHYNLELNL